MHVDRSITAEQTVSVLEDLVAVPRRPENLRGDNGRQLRCAPRPARTQGMRQTTSG
jgi:hypothetical protein